MARTRPRWRRISVPSLETSQEKNHFTQRKDPRAERCDFPQSPGKYCCPRCLTALQGDRGWGRGDLCWQTLLEDSLPREPAVDLRKESSNPAVWGKLGFQPSGTQAWSCLQPIPSSALSSAHCGSEANFLCKLSLRRKSPVKSSRFWIHSSNNSVKDHILVTDLLLRIRDNSCFKALAIYPLKTSLLISLLCCLSHLGFFIL